MTDEWSTFTIGEISEAIFDGPHATPTKTDSGPIFLGISNLQGGRIILEDVDHLAEEDFQKWTRRVTPQKGDIVFSYETRLGEAALVPDNLRFCLGRRMALIRPNKSRIDPQFLLYAYLGPEFQETIKARTIMGSTVDRIPLVQFPQFPISIPPLPEQRAIARILGALDDKIELNRKMNATLEAMAQALFKSWFVDFDPVTAKSEGRQPYGMNAETAALFPAEFVESELGRIPKGWEILPMEKIVTAVGGGTPSTENAAYWEGGTIAWSTPKDLSKLNFPVLLDTERKITLEGLKQISSGLLPAGTLLMSSRAPVGYLAISEIPTAINQGFIAMMCNKGIPREYIFQWLKANMEIIISYANGTTFMEISKSSFRKITVLVPSEKLLVGFAETAGKFHQMMIGNERQSNTLSSLRDTLLPKLLSGEIRVRDAEKRVEQAV